MEQNAIDRYVLGSHSEVHNISGLAYPEHVFDSLLVLYDKIRPSMPLDADLLSVYLSLVPPAQQDALMQRLMDAAGVKQSHDESEHSRGNTLVSKGKQLFSAIKNHAYSEYEERLAAVEKLLEADYRSRFAGRTVTHRLATHARRLAEPFGLTELDVQILTLIFVAEQNIQLARLFSGVNQWEFVKKAAMVLSADPVEIQRRTNSAAPLFSYGIVGCYFDPAPYYDVCTPIAEYLRDPHALVPVPRMFHRAEPTRRHLSDFCVVEARDREAAAELVSAGPCHLLLYGLPGTGKTEFARALLSATGTEGYFLTIAEASDEKGEPQSRLNLLLAREHLGRGQVLIVDESDSLLNSENLGSDSEKGWIVDFMDSTRTTVIWISNSVGGIHPAVARRLTLSLKFGRYGVDARQTVWQRLLDDAGISHLLSAGDVRSLAEEFRVTPGSIATSVEASKRLVDQNGGIATAVARRVLSSQMELLGRAEDSDDLRPVRRDFVREAVNVSGPADDLETAMTGRKGQTADRAIHCLFIGPSGTGKTEYARYLAGRAGRTVRVVTAESLMGQSVSETIMQLRDCFADVALENELLCIEQADLLLAIGNDGGRLRENILATPFLRELAKTQIPVICTLWGGELSARTSSAFPWKLRFEAPSPQQVAALVEKLFGDGITVDHGIAGATHATIVSARERFATDTVGRPSGGTIAAILSEEVECTTKREPRVLGFSSAAS